MNNRQQTPQSGRKNDSEHRVSVEEYKKQVCNLYLELQQLLKNDDLEPQHKIILQRAEKIVQNETKKLAALSQAQFIQLSEQLETIQESGDAITERTQKNKKKKVFVPLRDPVLGDTFETIFNAPLIATNNFTILANAQFKITFLVLYLTGARVNEVKRLTKKDFNDIKKNTTITY